MKKKLLIITGANGQVGSYLARSHEGSGDPLLLLYHEDSERVADLRVKKEVRLKACDLTLFEQTRKAIEDTSRELDAVPARLIHTAALRSYDAQPLAKSDPDIFFQVLQTNLMMAYNVLRACLPDMIANKFGRIVLFGSNVVSTGLRNGAAYSAAKAGIVNLVKSVALETANANLLINSISPAPVESDLEADYSGDYLK
ncbi:MAG: SDR family oxidoreductase, partial [Candidatus Syntrophosphaera sp.]